METAQTNTTRSCYRRTQRSAEQMLDLLQVKSLFLLKCFNSYLLKLKVNNVMNSVTLNANEISF